MGPRILVRHFHIPRNRCCPKTDLGVGKLEASTGACEGDVEWFTGEFIDIGKNNVSQNSEQVETKTQK